MATIRSLLFDTEIEKLRPAVRELAKLCADYYLSPSDGKLKIAFAKISKDFPDISYVLFEDASDRVHWHAMSETVEPLKNRVSRLDPRLQPLNVIETRGETYVDIGDVTDTLPRLPVHVGFPRSLLQRRAYSLFLTRGAIAMIALTTGLIAAFLFTSWVARPVLELSSLAEKMSLGDMDARLDLKYKGEVGKVFSSLERLKESVLYAARRLDGPRQPTDDRVLQERNR